MVARSVGDRKLVQSWAILSNRGTRPTGAPCLGRAEETPRVVPELHLGGGGRISGTRTANMVYPQPMSVADELPDTLPTPLTTNRSLRRPSRFRVADRAAAARAPRLQRRGRSGFPGSRHRARGPSDRWASAAVARTRHPVVWA